MLSDAMAQVYLFIFKKATETSEAIELKQQEKKKKRGKFTFPANLQCFTGSKAADAVHKQRGAGLTDPWM